MRISLVSRLISIKGPLPYFRFPEIVVTPSSHPLLLVFFSMSHQPSSGHVKLPVLKRSVQQRAFLVEARCCQGHHMTMEIPGDLRMDFPQKPPNADFSASHVSWPGLPWRTAKGRIDHELPWRSDHLAMIRGLFNATDVYRRHKSPNLHYFENVHGWVENVRIWGMYGGFQKRMIPKWMVHHENSYYIK